MEETENSFANTVINRKDIDVVLIRFSNCLRFSKAHLKKTASIPVFVIDKYADFAGECRRFQLFMESLDITVDYFYNDSEFNQEYIQRFARALSLPGALSEEQARIVRDKISMKEFIRDIGYPCVSFRHLHSIDDAIACANSFGFPFIIKWRKCVSSMEVYRIESFDELYRLSIDYSFNRYMAEAFCPFKIWCIDAIVTNGRIVNNFYTWLPYTNLKFAEDKQRFMQLATGKTPGTWRFNPRQLTSDVVDRLGVSDGYLHLEAFITDEGLPIICEFAWRTPGDHMLSNFSTLYNISIQDMLIDALLKRSVESLEEPTGCVADVFMPMKEGRITAISTLSQINEVGEILDGELYYKVGDELKNEHRYTDCSGWIQLRADSIAEMMQKIDLIYNTFVLQTERD